MKKLALVTAYCMSFALLLPGMLFANKSAVSIEVPAEANRGGDVVIRITVTHSANSFFHYTEWARLDVDGKTVGRWEYSRTDRPDGATFTKEVRVKALKTMEVLAEASCNTHGSAGPAKTSIAVRD